jgi:hypothetical protein
MMLPTHALVGMALAVPLALAAPEFGTTALVAGLLGGAVPDLDMYVGHRKTLHYPVYYTGAAVVLAAVAVAVPSPVTVAAVAFAVGAAAHCLADVFGGGLELRPWEGTSDRAVYDHYHGRWLAPRRWIGYDGSPGDFALAAAVGLPLSVTVGDPLRPVVFGALAVAGVYAVVRRLLPEIAERLVRTVLAPALPPDALSYLPARYLQAADHAPRSDRTGPASGREHGGFAGTSGERDGR